MRRRRRLVVTLYASIALATTAVVLAFWAGHVLRSTELETVDARFAIRGERSAPDAWIRARGGEDFKIGIGLNAGPVMAGNVGSQRRMEPVVVWSVV